MIITNTDYVPDRKIVKILGIVRGSCVKARWLGKDIRAFFRTLIGGEMKYYTELLEDSRKTATDRMIEDAIKLNADAIVNIRYQTSMIMAGASEILVYGTAVKLQ